METDEADTFNALSFELTRIIFEQAPKGTGFLVLFFDEDSSETLGFTCSNPEHIAPAYLRFLAVMPKAEDDEDDHVSTR